MRRSRPAPPRWGRCGPRPDPEAARDPAQLPASSGTCATCSRSSGPSCASTSSPATTRSGPSAATSAAGSTRRPSWRTTTSASAPTTTSSTPPATRSSSTARSRPSTHRPPRTPASEGAAAVRQGARRGPRPARKAFRPTSVVNISGMSFGALSAHAVEALNRGAAWPAACTTPARAAVALPPPRRRPRLPDRHRLLRLPRRRRAASTWPPLEDAGRRGPGPRHRDQAVARAPSPASAACCRRPR